MMFNSSEPLRAAFFEEYGVADLFSASKASNHGRLLTGFSELDQILSQIQQ
jgi:hypothetical protein